MRGKQIFRLHTLGPTGTNCEAAAKWWLKQRGEVVLHPTLEDAAQALDCSNSALLGCVVYPDLHNLVFSNIDKFRLEDIFIFPTHNMVLASRTETTLSLVSSHPAPVKLIPPDLKVRLVTSNSQAALDCANGLSDACITTLVSAEKNGLKIRADYGPVNMGFTIHRVIEREGGAK